MTYNSLLVRQMVATGPPASREFNDEIALRVVAGDEAARKRMIEANMPMVLAKVDTFLKVYPFARPIYDDLISEGFLGLTEAVENLGKNGDTTNPTGFISFHITGAIGRTVDAEYPQIAEDHEAPRRHRKRRPRCEQMPVDPVPMVDLVVDPTAMVELRDLLEACCETDIDREIIRLRERGYQEEAPDNLEVCREPAMTDKEIAEALNLSVTTVYMLRRAIYARLLEKSGMEGEV